jgi:hypothetical protein
MKDQTMSTSEPIELPAELFARLADAHRRNVTADTTGRHQTARRELAAAATAGHARLTPQTAFLVAQYAARIDQTTERSPHQEEADFYAFCDLIPASELARIHAEDQAERLATNAEYATWRATNQTRTQP